MELKVFLVLMYLINGEWRTFEVAVPTLRECHALLYARAEAGASRSAVETFTCAQRRSSAQ